MKKILNNILITIIFVIPFIANINIVDAKILKYGDIDENGVINSSDITIIEEFINNTKTPTPIQKALADINKDGTIDNTDKNLAYQIMNKPNEKLYQLGDVNMNGIIDPIDINIILYATVNKNIELSDFQKELADTDYSGTITALDKNRILKYINENLLIKKIINSVSTGPNFAVDSTDNGLYVQVNDKTKTENGFPVYYYRGPVENNYVQLGTYKTDIIHDEEIIAHANDPMIFRIVSISSDGSIKLVLENNTTIWHKMFKFNATGFSKYINDDGSNSDIKTELERWYSTYINENVDSKVMKTNYCNDITGIDFNSDVLTDGNANERLNSKNPTFICPEGSIIDNNKVGTLTLDDVIYAGGIRKNSTDEYIPSYLNTNPNFLIMTAENQKNVYKYLQNHIEEELAILSNESIRPVITLKPNVLVTGNGDGTKDNPYVIDLKNEAAVFDEKNIYNTIIMNTVNEESENIITAEAINMAKENKTTTITYETYNTSSDNGKFKYSIRIPLDFTDEAKDINTYMTIKDNITASDDEIYHRMKYALGNMNNNVRYIRTRDFDLTSSNYSTIIEIDVSDKYADGTEIYRYRWDDSKKRYLNAGGHVYTSNGRATIFLQKGGNYIITDTDLSSIVENPPTGMIMFVVIGIIGLLLIGGITYLIYSKKNNRFLKV